MIKNMDNSGSTALLYILGIMTFSKETYILMLLVSVYITVCIFEIFTENLRTHQGDVWHIHLNYLGLNIEQLNTRLVVSPSNFSQIKIKTVNTPRGDHIIL